MTKFLAENIMTLKSMVKSSKGDWNESEVQSQLMHSS